MVYWFSNFPTAPLKFSYSNQQYNEDHKYIESLIVDIKMLDESPAMMTEHEKRCRFCVYRSLCKRGIEAGPFKELDDDNARDPLDFELDFEQITEIEF
jgi:hypothetical protein